MERVKIFKVVLLGDPEVGKSAFIKRFSEGTFDEKYVRRAGVNFTPKTVSLSDGKEVSIHFWDILGTTRVIDQPSVYLRNTQGAIVMYDANNPHGKAHVAEWKTILDTCVTTMDGQPHIPPAILVANKLDLVCQKSDEYDREELYATRDQLNFAAAYPCSVAAGWNLNPIILALIAKMIEKSYAVPTVSIESPNDEVFLTDDQVTDKTKKDCTLQ
jgi:small GTP-binding protein